VVVRIEILFDIQEMVY